MIKYFMNVPIITILLSILANVQQGWIIQSSGTSNSLYGINFINESTGWAVGDNGTILRTINEGENWSSQTSSVFARLNYVFFINENTGWVAGGVTTGNAVILKTTNGGANWELQQSGTTNFLNQCYFVNESTGWMCGFKNNIEHNQWRNNMAAANRQHFSIFEFD